MNPCSSPDLSMSSRGPFHVIMLHMFVSPVCATNTTTAPTIHNDVGAKLLGLASFPRVREEVSVPFRSDVKSSFLHFPQANVKCRECGEMRGSTRGAEVTPAGGFWRKGLARAWLDVAGLHRAVNGGCGVGDWRWMRKGCNLALMMTVDVFFQFIISMVLPC